MSPQIKPRSSTHNSTDEKTNVRNERVQKIAIRLITEALVLCGR